MKIFAPKYYTEFSCIADRCRHSCCIGWEIDIDADTAEKYRRMTGAYATAVLDSIEPGDPPHFRLGEGERCPHLDEKGLCRIIKACGEEPSAISVGNTPAFTTTPVADGRLGSEWPARRPVVSFFPPMRTRNLYPWEKSRMLSFPDLMR